MSELNILGIDIAKAKFDVALIVGDKYKTKVFSNNPSGFTALSDWLVKQQVTHLHACMEATSRYGEALATYLFNAGFTVSVVNPAKVKFFAQAHLLRNKTDKLDAAIIARFCALMKPEPWQPAPPITAELVAMVQRLAVLTDMHSQEHNRLETTADSVIDSLHDSLAHLKQQIKILKKRIQTHIKQHPKLRQQAELLRSIPGVGPATVATVLAFLPDISRFEHQNHLVAFAGLNPKQRTSGSSLQGKSSLSKVGHAPLRKALFLPAMVALKHNPALQALAQRLHDNHKSKMCILGAAMRKLLVIIYGVLKSLKPFDAALALPR